MIHPKMILAAITALTLLTALPPTAAAADAVEDVVIDQDTTLSRTTWNVEGNLTITDNATLRLEGTVLRVGGGILVEEGARLELGPSDARATELGPLDPDVGFEMQVRGGLHAGGTPQTVIWGLRGDPFLAALYGVGGLVVQGTAELENVHLRDGTAGVVVEPEGYVHISDSILSNLNFTAVAARGPVDVDNTTFIGNGIAVSGKDTCDFDVRDVHVEPLPKGQGFLANSCRGHVERATMTGGNNAISVNGDGYMVVRDSTFHGYEMVGIHAKSQPRDGGATARPILRVANVSLEAADGLPAEEPDTPDHRTVRGIHVRSAALIEITDSMIRNNPGPGILLQQSLMDLRDNVIQENGRQGIRSILGQYKVEPLEAGNDFGSVAAGTANGKGAVGHLVVLDAFARDQDGTMVPGISLQVFPKDSDEAVFSAGPSDRISISLEVYEPTSDGSSRNLAPFLFRATHEELDEPVEGTLPIDGTDLALQLESSGFLVKYSNWILFTAGALLFIYALFGKHILKRTPLSRRAENPDDEAGGGPEGPQ